MISKINTIEDVKQFAHDLVNEGVNFHPDDDFDNYINLETNEKTYSDREATLRNWLMCQSFEVCEYNGLDIYLVMGEILINNLNLTQ